MVALLHDDSAQRRRCILVVREPPVHEIEGVPLGEQSAYEACGDLDAPLFPHAADAREVLLVEGRDEVPSPAGAHTGDRRAEMVVRERCVIPRRVPRGAPNLGVRSRREYRAVRGAALRGRVAPELLVGVLRGGVAGG